MMTHDGLIVNNCHASCMPQFQGSLALRGKEAKKNTVKKNTVVATLKKVLISFVSDSVIVSYFFLFCNHTTAGGDQFHIKLL